MTSPVDIRPDQLEIVQHILLKHMPAGVKVWVFGSRANWTTKDSSDLDLALEGQGKLSHKVLGALKDAFEDSSLPYTVDVVDFNRIGDSFKQIVESQRTPLPLDGVVTYGADLTGTSGEWGKATLGGVCTKIGSGATPRGGRDVYLESGPYSLIRSQNVYNDGFRRDGLAFIGEHHADALENVEVFEGDVLLNITGDSVARACQVPTDALPARVNQHVAIVRPNSGILDPEYLRYYLVSAEMQTLLLSWAGSGGTRNALTKGMIESLEIPLPPLPQQRAIAHVLGTLDDKIELNRRKNQTLESMARALFKSWFVDFDPVHAKMEGRWRRVESLLGLPAEHYDLFPDRLVNSELGEIPEGWEVKPLGELVELAYGKALRAGDRKDGPVPVYGSNGQVGWHDARLVAGPGIVVGRKGNPGVVTWAHGDFFPIDTTFYVVPRDANGGLPFLFFALTSQDLPSVSADSAVPGLNRNLAYMNKQLVPDKQVLTEFNDYTAAIFSRRHRLEHESRDLAAQRDALLPGLVSGEIQASDRNTTV